MTKREVRSQFRSRVFTRDGYRCRVCGATTDLVAHHITDRHMMPGGGYAPENGVTLCPACHALAEQFHMTGAPASGFAPHELYALIGVTMAAAHAASQRFVGRAN